MVGQDAIARAFPMPRAPVGPDQFPDLARLRRYHQPSRSSGSGRQRGAIMWWTRHKPGQWVAACRDIAGRRREILVVPTKDARVALIFPPGEVAVLEPLQAGRLRAALRDVVFALDEPATREEHRHAVPTVRASA
jgi:hypothetical protein